MIFDNLAPMVDEFEVDYLIIGAGLSGLLTGLSLSFHQPDKTFVILERSSSLPSNKTWCAHQSDLQWWPDWFESFITKSFDQITLKFPEFKKTLPEKYLAIDAEDFSSKAYQLLEHQIRLNQNVMSVKGETVQTQNAFYRARIIINATGDQVVPSSAFGFQDFVGYTIKTSTPHFISSPIIMDSTIEQKNGFRFLYIIPWTENELLVEDTRYQSNQDQTLEHIEQDLQYYLQENFTNYEVLKKERGSLPLLLDLSKYLEEYPRLENSIGYRGGFFHGTTGYSLFYALYLAEQIGTSSFSHQRQFENWLSAEWKKQKKRLCINAFLNRLIFKSAKPHQAYKIFQRFYMLPQWTRQNFYRNHLDFKTLARVFWPKPKPPVEVMSALYAFNLGLRHEKH